MKNILQDAPKGQVKQPEPEIDQEEQTLVQKQLHRSSRPTGYMKALCVRTTKCIEH